LFLPCNHHHVLVYFVMLAYKRLLEVQPCICTHMLYFSSFLSYDAVFLTMFLVLLIAEKNMTNYSYVKECSLCLLIFYIFFLSFYMQIKIFWSSRPE
jgi:hypothetical protein